MHDRATLAATLRAFLATTGAASVTARGHIDDVDNDAGGTTSYGRITMGVVFRDGSAWSDHSPTGDTEYTPVTDADAVWGEIDDLSNALQAFAGVLGDGEEHTERAS